MRRALELAQGGRGFVSPNPMVGAVIVDRAGRIIGEGYHRRFGGPHAEVNAVNSVADKQLLRDATIYVTLEPCSHYGKTPPCAKLLVDCGFRRVVVGCGDPNEKVSGRGIKMLREAGIKVKTGVLEEECRALNKTFMKAQTRHLPYVLLKWAMSADGYTDCDRSAGQPAPRFSTPLSSVAVHQLRAEYDAIMVGSQTVINDNPRLDTRLVDGRSPIKVVIDRRGRVPADALLFNDGAPVLYFGPQRELPERVTVIPADSDTNMLAVLQELYRLGISSVMVEGGNELRGSFIGEGLFDEARVEINPRITLGDRGCCRAAVPIGTLSESEIDGNIIINVKE